MTTITIERALLEQALVALSAPNHCVFSEPPICVDIRAALAAPATAPERRPMTDEQITKLLGKVRMRWVSSHPTYEAARAFARAVEAFRGITGGKT